MREDILCKVCGYTTPAVEVGRVKSKGQWWDFKTQEEVDAFLADDFAEHDCIDPDCSFCGVSADEAGVHHTVCECDCGCTTHACDPCRMTHHWTEVCAPCSKCEVSDDA